MNATRQIKDYFHKWLASLFERKAVKYTRKKGFALALSLTAKL